MKMLGLNFVYLVVIILCVPYLSVSVVRAEQDEELSYEQKVCRGKSAGEYTRLPHSTGEYFCRVVIYCTAAGPQTIRCPPGLAFDLEKQTCDWEEAVQNCHMLTKDELRKTLPLLYTDEPICVENHLACGDGNCIKRGFFCNGVKDCKDGSDENACGIDEDPNRAPACDKEICKLPGCFCSKDGTEVPGELCPSSFDCERVPQMVTITFNGAINQDNIEMYDNIFRRERRNANGCTIKGTFFFSHKHSNYSAVQNFHHLGHEIAAHSITHNNDEKYWTEANVDTLAKEMAGSRLIIEKFANITDNSVLGLRVPHLRVGGNNQFTMMEEQAFLYDSSITAPLQNPPLWPYTMYFKMSHKCQYLQNCPTRSHAVWEMVINELDRREDPTVDKDMPGCAMIDSCSNIVTGDQFYNFLTHNFYRHFNQNRAPLGLNFHSAWLNDNPELLTAFLYWIDEVLENHKNAYFTTLTQVIRWIQEPVDIDSASDFAPWQERCDPGPRTECLGANECKLTSEEVLGEFLDNIYLSIYHSTPGFKPMVTM